MRKASEEFIVDAQSGKAFRVRDGESIRIIDVEGKQVADFWAIHDHDPHEFLSPAVTLDCNQSLYISQGEYLYTNLYRPMLQIEADDVGKHDLLHPCCRPEMYDYFYKNGKNHPNCFENLLSAVQTIKAVDFSIIQPFNIFMQTKIYPDGRISVEEPLSKPGDSIRLRAMMNMVVALAACSVSESKCNGRYCTPLKVIING
jgi:uncharacterized protein YcgI (DUF1989 family)